MSLATSIFHLPGPRLDSQTPVSNPMYPTASNFLLPCPRLDSQTPSSVYRKRGQKQRLYDIDRKAICEYYLAHPTEKQEYIARLYGVERSTISKILKHKEKWLNVDARSYSTGGSGLRVGLAKDRPPKFPVVELEMRKWLMEASDRYYGALPDASLPKPSHHPPHPHATALVRGPFSDACLREKAGSIARSHGIPPEQFKASPGWVENFKRRHNIKGGFWGGYSPTSSNVVGEHGTGVGVTRTAPIPPLLASSFARKLPPRPSRYIASTLKHVHQAEKNDSNDESTDAYDSSYRQPCDRYSCPPWETGSSSTGDLPMGSHTSQACIFDHPPLDSHRTASRALSTTLQICLSKQDLCT